MGCSTFGAGYNAFSRFEGFDSIGQHQRERCHKHWQDYPCGSSHWQRSLIIDNQGVSCKSGRSSGTIAPSTGQTCKQIPQSIQVEKSIQYQSVPFVFLLGPGWIQATGQASTQSATPSQTFVTIVCGIIFSQDLAEMPEGIQFRGIFTVS